MERIDFARFIRKPLSWRPVFMLVLILLTGFFLGGKYFNVRQELNYYQQEDLRLEHLINKKEKEASGEQYLQEKIIRKEERVFFLKNLFPENNIIDITRQIISSIPENLYITLLQVVTGKKVILEGYLPDKLTGKSVANNLQKVFPEQEFTLKMDFSSGESGGQWFILQFIEEGSGLKNQ